MECEFFIQFLLKWYVGIEFEQFILKSDGTKSAGGVEYTVCIFTERYDPPLMSFLDMTQNNMMVWGIQRTPSLLLLSGPLWSGVIAPNRRCPWCNGYRRGKWTRRQEFKSWTRLIAFHIALILSGKVWIHLFSLQLWVNSRADWVLQPWRGN